MAMAKGEVPGFIAQMKSSVKFKENYAGQFSIYLSNDINEKGKVIFGGYNIEKYAKKGSSEKDIFWANQARNEEYWAINNKQVNMGDKILAS